MHDQQWKQFEWSNREKDKNEWITGARRMREGYKKVEQLAMFEEKNNDKKGDNSKI